jgi:hypothetical protein
MTTPPSAAQEPSAIKAATLNKVRELQDTWQQPLGGQQPRPASAMPEDLIVIGIAPGGVRTAPIASIFGLPSLYPLIVFAAVLGLLRGLRQARRGA